MSLRVLYLFEDRQFRVPVTAGRVSIQSLEINVPNFSTLKYPTDNEGYVYHDIRNSEVILPANYECLTFIAHVGARPRDDSDSDSDHHRRQS
jgi:hypothetical protein